MTGATTLPLRPNGVFFFSSRSFALNLRLIVIPIPTMNDMNPNSSLVDIDGPGLEINLRKQGQKLPLIFVKVLSTKRY